MEVARETAGGEGGHGAGAVAVEGAEVEEGEGVAGCESVRGKEGNVGGWV